MDTRKLVTAIAFSLFATTGFAQLVNLQEATPYKTAPSETGKQDLDSSNPVTDDITIYRTSGGINVVRWTTGKDQALEFLLQGSKDGVSFRVIKRVVATTSNTDLNIYEASDESGKGYTQFRVIHISTTGNYYSKSVSSR